jgi:hypothetical protein
MQNDLILFSACGEAFHAYSSRGEGYEGADKHKKERLGEDQGERQEIPLIRSGGPSGICFELLSRLRHTVLLFLLRSNTQRLPNRQCADRDTRLNQRAFLPLSLAFAHRARIPSEILFFAAADRRRLRLGDFAPAGTAGRRIE